MNLIPRGVQEPISHGQSPGNVIQAQEDQPESSKACHVLEELLVVLRRDVTALLSFGTYYFHVYICTP